MSEEEKKELEKVKNCIKNKNKINGYYASIVPHKVLKILVNLIERQQKEIQRKITFLKNEILKLGNSKSDIDLKEKIGYQIDILQDVLNEIEVII